MIGGFMPLGITPYNRPGIFGPPQPFIPAPPMGNARGRRANNRYPRPIRNQDYDSEEDQEDA